MLASCERRCETNPIDARDQLQKQPTRQKYCIVKCEKCGGYKMTLKRLAKKKGLEIIL